MRVQVLLNPQADQGRGRQYKAEIEALAQRFGGAEVLLTESADHARTQALQAAQEGYDVVVAAGGDGTVHEVINGLYQARTQGIDVALGIIPIGSGNDFAFANGILSKMETAVSRIFTGQPHLVDLARIEDEKGRVKVFDNNFGLGFDAVVVIETQKVTRVRGFLMYLLAVFRTMAFYYDVPHVEMVFDDEKASQDILFLAMGVGPRGGGGFLLVPDAKNDDNLIDSCTVNPINRLTMLYMITKTFNGSHVTSRHVTMRKNQRIDIRSNMPMPIHIDGEMFCYPKDEIYAVTVTSLPAAMKVMI